MSTMCDFSFPVVGSSTSFQVGQVLGARSRNSAPRCRRPHTSMADIFRRLLFAGHGADPADNLLPAFTHIPEREIVLRRHEAGMHETKPCAAVDLGESQGDARVEARAILRIAVIAALPRIRQTLVALYFKPLTANHAVPRASRRRLIRKARAFDGLKSRRLHQQPAADEFAGRQDSADGLRRMGKHLLDDDVL